MNQQSTAGKSWRSRRTSSDHLGAVASRALTWSFANTALSRFGTVGIGIVLARLLGPEAFGTFAVATVALLAILSFNELGVTLAIVRWPSDPRAILPTVTSISVVSSLILTIAAVCSAPAFSAAMGDPSATAVVQLMALCIFINGVVACPAAQMQREFRQQRRMAIDQANVWVGAVLSVVLAVGGMGAMSLAIGRVTGTVLAAALFLCSSPTSLRFGFDVTIAKHLLRFGLPLAGSSVLVFLVGYADQLTAGVILGTTALGFYVLAFNLASWPVSLFSQPLRSVAPAAFARLQHDRGLMTQSLSSVIGLLAAATIPICFFLAGAAQPIIEVIYGTVWADAAPVLTWLALLAAFRIFFELAYDYLVVLGRSSVILKVQVIWLAILLPGLIVSARALGLEGLSGIQVAVAAAFVLPAYLWEFRKSGLPLRLVFQRIRVPLIAGIVVGAVAYGLSLTDLPDLQTCIAAGSFCFLVIVALAYRDRRSLSTLRRLSA